TLNNLFLEALNYQISSQQFNEDKLTTYLAKLKLMAFGLWNAHYEEFFGKISGYTLQEYEGLQREEQEVFQKKKGHLLEEFERNGLTLEELNAQQASELEEFKHIQSTKSLSTEYEFLFNFAAKKLEQKAAAENEFVAMFCRHINYL